MDNNTYNNTNAFESFKIEDKLDIIVSYQELLNVVLPAKPEQKNFSTNVIM